MQKLYISNSEISYEALLLDEIALDDSVAFREFIAESRRVLDEKIDANEPIYGVNTGYGASGANAIDRQDAKKLQINLYRFHGCGVGAVLSKEIARRVILSRMVSLAKGKSGVSYALLERMALLLKRDIIPVIPSQGSVGASGDLTPLSYLAAVMAGEREVYYEEKIEKTADVYARLGIRPYVFEPKEALSIMNGTSVMSAIALCGLERLELLFERMLDFVAGVYELLECDTTPLEPFVHESKPFKGQIEVAKRVRERLKGSELTIDSSRRAEDFYANSTTNIQDSYSIRCVPQILGPLYDAIEMAKEYVSVEINSVNDNPLIDIKTKRLYTTGNFYGGYVATAMDNLKIALANMADLLDKEFALLVDAKFNRGLGENLKLEKSPYYHGFKAMQITLSSLCGDVLKNTNAASLYSRPTESLNQDKVSMGTTAALDFYKMQEDVANMLSIALLGLAQGVDIKSAITDKKTSNSLYNLHKRIREVSQSVCEDRRLDVDIEALKEYLLKSKE